MKTETNHTPTPWRVGPRHPCRIIAGCGQNVAATCLPQDEHNETDEERENAVFIVDACNNYERLKAQRDELAAALNETMTDLERWPGDKNPQFFYSMKLARAALAKLKGE